MFDTMSETTLEVWHLPYAILILWVTGLGGFYFTASSADPPETIEKMRNSWIGLPAFIWMTLSCLAATYAWPLLVILPIELASNGYMPWSASVIFLLYMCLVAACSYTVMMQRFAPHFLPRWLRPSPSSP